MGQCGSQFSCTGPTPCQGFSGGQKISSDEDLVCIDVKNDETQSVSGSTVVPDDCSPNSSDRDRATTLGSIGTTPSHQATSQAPTREHAPSALECLDSRETSMLPELKVIQVDSCAPSPAEAESTSETLSPAQAAADAEKRAERCMAQCRVLEAEAILALALQHLERNQSDAGAEAEKRLRQSEVYIAVMDRLSQYVAVAEILTSTTMKLCWEKEGSSLWVHAPPGATWFEFKIATDIDAPLHCCLAYANEVDMIPKYEPMLVGPPEFLGPVLPLLAVTRSLIGLLLFRIELLFEVFRVTNEDFGFLVESIRADFPHEGRPIPQKHWRYKRIGVDTKNVWIPQGGGKIGTTCIQACRVDCGFRIPEAALSYFCKHLAGGMVSNMRKNSCRASEPGSPWKERMELDKFGLYKECKKAEVAAERRMTISAASLPPMDIFNRAGPSLVK